MQVQVYKIHSDFYHVKNFKHDEYICKLKDTLKKQKIEIKVGDFVELSNDNNFITKLLTRKNTLTRPKVSNIDSAIVVASIKEPELDFVQLNRYLIYLKYHNIDCAICINKEDLDKNPSTTIDKIKSIYEKLNYKIFFISAKNKTGFNDLLNYIKDKTIVLTGMSGVGKSTMLNALNPNISIRTNDVSKKTLRGCHTTRHVEIIECDGFKIADTPGFSNLKFDFLLPHELVDCFDDLKIYKGNCKYSNCLHNAKEKNICSIYDNLDKIEETRYESYLCFLSEALEYKERISKISIKKEDFKKDTGSRIYTKISKVKRKSSRNTEKQRIKDIRDNAKD